MPETDTTTARRPGTVLLIHALVTVGGVAALSWEVVWQLQASLAFGVSALGTALTLAATMGGMTIGSLIAGAWLHERPIAHPLRAYGILELFIGITGLLTLPGFWLLELLDAKIYAVFPALAPVMHILGAGLLLAPATCAMGATVPLFQLVARRYGTRVSVLYGANTAGAATGVLLLSFILMPSFGVTVSCVIAAGLNVAVFLVTRGIDARAGGAAASADDLPVAATPAPVSSLLVATRTAPTRIAPELAQLVVACTGFVTFGLEVAWFRALRSAFWSTSSTFAIMLAAVLIALAIGARLVPWLRRRGVAPGVLLVSSGAAILLVTPLIERIDLVVGMQTPYYVTMLLWLLMSLALMGPAVICLSTVLPWCLEDYPDPAFTGRLYGVNTLGSVAGAIVTAWLLLPQLGFARSAWVLGLLVIAVALPLKTPRLRYAGPVAIVSLFIAVTFASSPGRDRMLGSKDFGLARVVAHEEGPDFTTSVVQVRNGPRVLMIDGFAATSDHPKANHYMFWMGSLPSLLHPDPKRGLVICFGTGQTANALRNEGLDAVDLVDISQAVFDLAPLFDANHQVLEDPRVNAITMDGRAWLRRTDRTYDVITLEPMPPNFAGVNALYSREFYELMTRRLSPDGVVAQWLPIHLLTPKHAASVSATFMDVFPDSILWVDPVGGTGILLGRQAGAETPLGTTWPGLDRQVTNRPLGRDEIRRSTFLDGKLLARYGEGAPIVTDDNQLLQYSNLRAGRNERMMILSNMNIRVLTEVAGRAPILTGLPDEG